MWVSVDTKQKDLIQDNMATINIDIDLIHEAIEHLNEVRTGEDFEVECWEVARKLECAVAGRDYKPDKDND